MGLVFVHGVNTRADDRLYQPWVDNYVRKLRTVAFRDVIPDSQNFPVYSPCWGGEAAKFRWKLASLPEGSVEAFGPDAAFEGLLQEVAPEEQVPHDQFLLNVARVSLENCVAVVYPHWSKRAPPARLPRRRRPGCTTHWPTSTNTGRQRRTMFSRRQTITN